MYYYLVIEEKKLSSSKLPQRMAITSLVAMCHSQVYSHNYVMKVVMLVVKAVHIVRWSSMVCEEHKYGHPRIHQLVASAYWKG